MQVQDRRHERIELSAEQPGRTQNANPGRVATVTSLRELAARREEGWHRGPQTRPFSGRVFLLRSAAQVVEHMTPHSAFPQEVLPVSASAHAWLRRDRRVARSLLPVAGGLLALALASLPL